MSTLKETLLEDLKTALREKDAIRKNTVQMVRAAVLQIEKDNRMTLDDQGVTDAIAKELKKRRDSMEEYRKSGRQELIDALDTEIRILLSYLPAQLSEAEVEAAVKQAIAETGAVSQRDIGKVMQAVMPVLKGKADGRLINSAVKKLLG